MRAMHSSTLKRVLSAGFFFAAAPFLLTGTADAQTVTFTIGEATGNPGDTAEVLISMDAGTPPPAAVTLLLEYDAGKIAPDETYYQFAQEDLEGGLTEVRAPVRPEQSIADAQKLVEYSIPSAGQLRLVVVGLNTLEIAEGPFLTAAFQLISGGSGEFVDIAGGAGSSAASSGSSPISLPLAFVDGGVVFGCDPADTPVNVQATQGLEDRVDVSWDPVAAPGALYRVFRSNDADSANAVPLGTEWQAATLFSDVTAQPARASCGFACCPPGEVVTFNYYYWVKARTAMGCESDFSAVPALGYRGAGKAQPRVRSGAAAAGLGDGALLCGAALMIVWSRRAAAARRTRKG